MSVYIYILCIHIYCIYYTIRCIHPGFSRWILLYRFHDHFPGRLLRLSGGWRSFEDLGFEIQSVSLPEGHVSHGEWWDFPCPQNDFNVGACWKVRIQSQLPKWWVEVFFAAQNADVTNGTFLVPGCLFARMVHISLVQRMWTIIPTCHRCRSWKLLPPIYTIVKKWIPLGWGLNHDYWFFPVSFKKRSRQDVVI